MEFHRDCKSFPGIYPCDTLVSDQLDCKDCKFYAPIGKKILIIKTGAIGDVLRTTTILPAIKEKYGSNTHITWIVDPASKDLLKSNTLIDRVWATDEKIELRLQKEKFDILFSLEITPPATLLANITKAREEYGYFYDKDGHPSAFNKYGLFYLNRVFSDQLNKGNTATYQDMIFEVCNLEYKQQSYALENTKKQKLDLDPRKKTIGINLGAGDRWRSKTLHPTYLQELINLLNNKYNIILLGGLNEEKYLENINKSFHLLHNNPNNKLEEFITWVNTCDVILTADSLALHIAIGLKKPTVALFYCTPDWEIEGYGLVTKLVSPNLKENFFIDSYNEELTRSIPVDTIYRAITKLLN